MYGQNFKRSAGMQLYNELPPKYAFLRCGNLSNAGEDAGIMHLHIAAEFHAGPVLHRSS